MKGERLFAGGVDAGAGHKATFGGSAIRLLRLGYFLQDKAYL